LKDRRSLRHNLAQRRDREGAFSVPTRVPHLSSRGAPARHVLSFRKKRRLFAFDLEEQKTKQFVPSVRYSSFRNPQSPRRSPIGFESQKARNELKQTKLKDWVHVAQST
jgi:hypothetical protein